jgi:cytochrome c oxidase subunit 4
MGLSYEEGKKKVFKGLWLLAVVTLIEVIISLFGKGHIVEGVDKMGFVIATAAIVIIALSIYKAYFIIYEFMHMRYEVRGLALSVLLPVLLLVWALVAFFNEGSAWKNNREDVQERNNREVEAPVGLLNDNEVASEALLG